MHGQRCGKRFLRWPTHLEGLRLPPPQRHIVLKVVGVVAAAGQSLLELVHVQPTMGVAVSRYQPPAVAREARDCGRQKFAEYLTPLVTVHASWYVRSSVCIGSSDETDGQKIAAPRLGATEMLRRVKRVSPPSSTSERYLAHASRQSMGAGHRKRHGLARRT